MLRHMSSTKDAALLAAVNVGDVARVKAMIEEGASLSARMRGWAALHLAAHAGNAELVRLLLDHGADVDVVMITDELIDRTRYEGTATPLLIALRARHEAVALLLLERGASVDHRDAFSGENALFLAAKHGLESVVERALAAAPARECKVFGDETALDAAATGGHLGIVRRLLAAGLPIAARALSEACRRGHLELAQLLVESGAVVNVASDHSPLLAAAGSGHVQMIDWLLAHGADLKRHGVGALHNAASFGRTETVLFLLQRGINVNSRDRHAWTPLMAAAWQGQRETTQALLDAGADPALEETTGKTALDWARQSHCRDAVPILEAHGLAGQQSHRRT